MDWNDVAYKTFWTALSAVLGVLVVALADAPYAWAPVAVAVINGALALLRQKASPEPTG